MSAILLNLQHQVLQQTFRYKKFFLYIERTSLVANKISHQIFCQEHGESLEFFFPLSKKTFKRLFVPGFYLYKFYVFIVFHIICEQINIQRLKYPNIILRTSKTIAS